MNAVPAAGQLFLKLAKPRSNSLRLNRLLPSVSQEAKSLSRAVVTPGGARNLANSVAESELSEFASRCLKTSSGEGGVCGPELPCVGPLWVGPLCVGPPGGGP